MAKQVDKESFRCSEEDSDLIGRAADACGVSKSELCKRGARYYSRLVLKRNKATRARQPPHAEQTAKSSN